MNHPVWLQQAGEQAWRRIIQTHPTLAEDIDPSLHCLQVLGLSDFIVRNTLREVSFLPWLLAHSEEKQRFQGYRSELRASLSAITDEAMLNRCVRQFRQREMSWIAWHDFINDWTVEQSLAHLSKLAEAIIMESYQWLYQQSCKEWGTPTNAQGEPQPLLILGMGKLGGSELNFSSDIDLIFTYPENGETVGARRVLANAQFFTRLGQRLIKALDQATSDGFCYRVDMRLRPFGDSGPLVMSYAALEDYYQEQGRDWERYAMVKARVLGRESIAQYQELRQMLRPFVFRRYMDFSAIQALRRMKAMIRSEVRRRGLTNNIKLGAGGIREIEFIVQTFQLIRGGREPSLRGRGLLKTLRAIDLLGLLPHKTCEQLQHHYRFLRRVENLLQAIDDKQTQTLPDDILNQQRLTHAMGHSNWTDLLSEIQQCMTDVHTVFVELIGDEDEDADNEASQAVFIEMWAAAHQSDLLSVILHDLNVVEAELQTTQLRQFKTELAKRTLGPRGRDVMMRLMPSVLAQLVERDDAPMVLSRVLNVIVKISTRTTYLELLVEYPNALAQLIRLCAASAMIADQVARYPVLLDALLDPQQLYHPTPLHEYEQELQEYLARIPEDDMEQQMEAIRQFKQTQLLRIAAADIADVLPITLVSDHLTYLAEAIVSAVVQQAWRQMTSKFGMPSHLTGRDGVGFAVLGYGKVGGRELGYGSDLDLVFVHDCPENVETNGEKVLDGRQFYLRLAQRIVHLFSTRTISGILYEIDMRLRPSGASGLLVTTLASFAEYQQQEAWTWEHQALVRARMIYGGKPLQQAFQTVRTDILCQPRDQKALASEVVKMREKMREHFGTHRSDGFDLKQGLGGITDIEFLAQYWVLAYATEYSVLTRWSDNLRIFELCAEVGVIDVQQAKALIRIYCQLRDKTHQLSLLGQSTWVEATVFFPEREYILEVWQNTLILPFREQE